MVVSAFPLARPRGWPSPVVVKVLVVVVVALVTAVLGCLGQAPGTSLAVMVMVTSTGLELAHRITTDVPDAGGTGRGGRVGVRSGAPAEQPGR
ncbi:hypothetical protein AB0F11_01460 [Streptomyces sp. NPDC032472]|uniref:hypothetical protein n=1 Tax=Streptomyces sp. NPDC032472 TaxID=3155018 RepID=UPI0033C93AD1